MDETLRRLASRAVLILAAGLVCLVAARKRTAFKARVKDFFLAESSPLNLAIFRIFFFASSLQVAKLQTLLYYSGMPHELLRPPPGSAWLIRMLPPNPEQAIWAHFFYRLFSVAALLGFLSRTSCLLAGLSAVYVLGIPLFFGKVDHAHAYVWFALLLAASPCGDALSMDAVRKQRRNPQSPQPGPSIIYGLPLRTAWVLFALIYFFPGFWKVWNVGFDWAWSGNLRYTLYRVWLGKENWQPFFRIDQHPWLLRMAGTGALFFELLFPVLIFFPILRPLAVAGGLVFHNMTRLFLQLSFSGLQACYVVFIDWQKILGRLGWGSAHPTAPPESRKRRSSLILMGIVGGGLIAVNALFGALRIVQGWPFACFPTFDRVETARISSLELHATAADGSRARLDERQLQQTMPLNRFRAMANGLVFSRDREKRAEKIERLVDHLGRRDPRVGKARAIEVYQVLLDTTPETQDRAVSRKLLWKRGGSGS